MSSIRKNKVILWIGIIINTLKGTWYLKVDEMSEVLMLLGHCGPVLGTHLGNFVRVVW